MKMKLRALARIGLGSAIATASVMSSAAFSLSKSRIGFRGLRHLAHQGEAISSSNRAQVVFSLRQEPAHPRYLSLQTKQGAHEEQTGAYSEGESVPLKVLYDGKCPLCLAEISFLENRSKKHGYTGIAFVDIAEPNYNPSENGNVSYEDAMKVMTVVRSDGSLSTGMRAFEDIYAQVGLPWVFSALKYPAVRKVADRVYDFWAKYRLEISFRGSLDAHLAKRKEDQLLAQKMREAEAACAGADACETKRGF